MKTLRLVREDEEERKRIARSLGYAAEACLECNEYTLGKEVTDEVDPVSPLICQTCGNRQLPIAPDYGDDVHTESPLPDGIHGLDLPLPSADEQIRISLRNWLRDHLSATKILFVVLGVACLVLAVLSIWRYALQFSGTLDHAVLSTAGAIIFFGIWYMLEVAEEKLWHG